MTPGEAEEHSERPKRLSCTAYFDALWFCYSPVHQMQQYYRLGYLDSCSQKWKAFIDCLYLKTKRASEVEEILTTREKAKTHIWVFRTPKEAQANWNLVHGHLNENKFMCTDEMHKKT